MYTKDRQSGSVDIMKWTGVLSLTVLLLMSVLPTAANENERSMVVIKLDDSLDDYWVVENKVAPKYPEKAIYKELEGCATVGFFIDADGSTSDHWVIASFPKTLFDRSALIANRKFAYSRGSLNPQGASVMTINTFTYQLAQKGQPPSKEKKGVLSSLCKNASIRVLEAQYGPIS